MARLERADVSQRRIGKEGVARLGIPDWDIVAEAIRAGKADEALDRLEYLRIENQRNNDSLVSFVEMVLTHLAGFGENALEEIIRYRYSPSVKEFLSVNRGVEEILQADTATHRRHHAKITVTEEPDRYVMRLDPCGSGGRLRRARSVGTTKEAHPWSWGKVGVSYYCCHCCMHWEILPTELQGYPVKVIMIGEKPEDPCVHLLYKRPELIPEEYFTRIGKKKDAARLKAVK